MCGLNGFYTKREDYTKEDLVNNAQYFTYRGPDAEGFFYNGRVGLGHKRLSIVDLSAASNQPFYSENGRYVIVYNGEIYNYKELSGKLKDSPKTNGDTEIIIELFSRYGASSFEMLKGMFALAIYDKETSELFLSRGRVGIKPLYYYWDGESLIFASEINPIRKILKSSIKINPERLESFLQLGFIPAPETIFENVFKVSPGSYLVFGKDYTTPVVKEYWGLTKAIEKELHTNETEVKKNLKELLIKAVEKQLPNEVSSGLLFSGGIDSSLLACIAKKELGINLPAYCLGFKDQKYQDSHYANEMARYLGLDYHQTEIDGDYFFKKMDEQFELFEEPYDLSSAVPTFALFAFMKDKVKVALSGEGADELFLGYNSHTWADRLSKKYLKLLPGDLNKLFKYTKYKKLEYLLNVPKEGYSPVHIFSQEQGYFSEREIVNNFRFKNYSEAEFLCFSETARKLTKIEEQSLFEMSYYLPDDLLMKLDKTSMYHSIEGRVPFLDYDLINYALNIDPKIKYKDNINKYLLKDMLAEYVPSKFLHRPKMGFSPPLELWFREKLLSPQFDELTAEINYKFDLYDLSFVKKLKNDYLAGNEYLYGRLWLIYILNKWLSKNS